MFPSSTHILYILTPFSSGLYMDTPAPNLLRHTHKKHSQAPPLACDWYCCAMNSPTDTAATALATATEATAPARRRNFFPAGMKKGYMCPKRLQG